MMMGAASAVSTAGMAFCSCGLALSEEVRLQLGAAPGDVMPCAEIYSLPLEVICRLTLGFA